MKWAGLELLYILGPKLGLVIVLGTVSYYLKRFNYKNQLVLHPPKKIGKGVHTQIN